jgi:Zn-finger nucleic acid-binding protein
MKCPVDGSTSLMMTERQGVEIDYCPECRGVWLDRGELDKIIERADNAAPQPAPAPPAPEARRRDDDYDSYDERRGAPKKKKKRSFLEDMFDFGG